MTLILDSETDSVSDSSGFDESSLCSANTSQYEPLSEGGTKTATMTADLYEKYEGKFNHYGAPAAETPGDDTRKAASDPDRVYSELIHAAQAISQQQERYTTVRAELLDSAENLMTGLTRLHDCQKEQNRVFELHIEESQSRLKRDCKGAEGAMKCEGWDGPTAELGLSKETAEDEFRAQLSSMTLSRDALQHENDVLKAQVEEFKIALERQRVEILAVRVRYENARVVFNLVNKVWLERECEEAKMTLEAAEAPRVTADQHLDTMRRLQCELETERRLPSIWRDTGEQEGRAQEEFEHETLENLPTPPGDLDHVDFQQRPPLAESKDLRIQRLKGLSTSYPFAHRSRVFTAVETCLQAIAFFNSQTFCARNNPLTEHCIPWPILQCAKLFKVEHFTADMFHVFFANAGQILPLSEYKDLLKALFGVFQPERWTGRSLSQFASGTSSLMDAIECPSLKKTIEKARKMAFQALSLWLLEVM